MVATPRSLWPRSFLYWYAQHNFAINILFIILAKVTGISQSNMSYRAVMWHTKANIPDWDHKFHWYHYIYVNVVNGTQVWSSMVSSTSMPIVHVNLCSFAFSFIELFPYLWPTKCIFRTMGYLKTEYQLSSNNSKHNKYIKKRKTNNIAAIVRHKYNFAVKFTSYNRNIVCNTDHLVWHTELQNQFEILWNFRQSIHGFFMFFRFSRYFSNGT